MRILSDIEVMKETRNGNISTCSQSHWTTTTNNRLFPCFDISFIMIIMAIKLARIRRLDHASATGRTPANFYDSPPL